MQKIFWFFFSLLFLFCGVFTFADLAGYTISNYVVGMQLYEDGSMEVAETIDVYFSEARHGIYRTIPFYSPSGRYTVIEKLRANGDTATSSTEGNTYQLKIGDANRTISWPHTYQISYTVKNAIAGFGTGNGAWTELYWNLIGTEWATTIDRVSFKLHLPKETAFSSGAYYVVYGRGGEKKTEKSQISFVGGSDIIGSVGARLWANEGVTIGVKFPSEYFNLSEKYLAIMPPLSFSSTSQQDILWIICSGIYLVIIGIFVRYKVRIKTFLPLLLFMVIGTVVSFVWTWGSCTINRYPATEWQCILTTALVVNGSVIVISFFVAIYAIEKYLRTYHSELPITIYYTPPKDIDIILAGTIYEVETFRMFISLIYYRAGKGYINISATSMQIGIFSKNTDYVLSKKTQWTEMDELLMAKLFTVSPTLSLYSLDYRRFRKFQLARKSSVAHTKLQYYSLQRKYVFWIFPCTVDTLNEKGQQLYEHLRGFAYYLSHVEKPRLEYELRNNVHYVDEILPRAVLFGVETKFLKAVEEIIQKPYQPERYSGQDRFSLAVISSIYSSVKSAATLSSESGSGWGWSSGFDGWWGSSGGWGGGGWGGSW